MGLIACLLPVPSGRLEGRAVQTLADALLGAVEPARQRREQAGMTVRGGCREKERESWRGIASQGQCEHDEENGDRGSTHQKFLQ